MKVTGTLILLLFSINVCFSQGGGGLPPSLPSSVPSSGGAGGSNTATQIEASLKRFETVIEEDISPALDRGVDAVEEALKPKNLFLAGFATTAGAVLGGAVINGAISGLGELTKLLMTDWDQIKANVYFDNLDKLWSLKERQKVVEERYDQLIRSYNQVTELRMKLSEEEMRDYLKELALKGACESGVFSKSTFDKLMIDGEKVLYNLLFPEQLRQQICDFLLIRTRDQQKLEDAKSKIIANFSAMAKKEIENFREQQEDKYEAIRDDFLKEEMSEYNEARGEFIDCLRNSPLRQKTKFSKPPYVDARGKEVDLIVYWNEKFSVEGPDGSLPGPVISQKSYSKLKRGNINTPPGGRAPNNMIFLQGPRSSKDISKLRCPYKDPSKVPIIGVLINLFKDVNEECEELRKYFLEATNNEEYCKKQATEGFKAAERKVEELRGASVGQVDRDVQKRKMEIEASRKIVSSWAREGLTTKAETNRLISEEWDKFNKSACFSK